MAPASDDHRYITVPMLDVLRKSGVIFKNDDGSNAILEMELMMFKTEEQDMSSPKVSTIIIIIAGEPEGDDLEIVWDAIPFEKEKENLRANTRYLNH